MSVRGIAKRNGRRNAKNGNECVSRINRGIAGGVEVFLSSKHLRGC